MKVLKYRQENRAGGYRFVYTTKPKYITNSPAYGLAQHLCSTVVPSLEVPLLIMKQ